MVDAADIYVVTGDMAWIDFPVPGFHRQAGRTLNPVTQRDAKVIFNTAIMVYTSQHKVKGAVNDAPNKEVWKVYRCNPSVIRVREF